MMMGLVLSGLSSIPPAVAAEVVVELVLLIFQLQLLILHYNLALLLTITLTVYSHLHHLTLLVKQDLDSR